MLQICLPISSFLERRCGSLDDLPVQRHYSKITFIPLLSSPRSYYHFTHKIHQIMSNTDNYSTMAANGSAYEYGISLLPSKIKRPSLLTSFNFRSEPSFQGPSQRSTIQALAFRRVHDFVSNTGPPNPVCYGEATITVA